MPVQSHTLQIKTRGSNDTNNLTVDVQDFLDKSGISDGIATVFVPGSTAGITTIEFEPGAVEDLNRAIERLVPQNGEYKHNMRWGDGNGFSHVRAALIGPSLTVPVIKRRLQLGTWQQIILIDFDNRARTREVIIQLVGE